MMCLFQAAGGGADRFFGMRTGRCADRSRIDELFPNVGHQWYGSCSLGRACGRLACPSWEAENTLGS